jgi:hypothetical protein
MKQFALVLVFELLFTMVLQAPASVQEERPVQSTDSKTEIFSVRAGSAAEIADLLHELYTDRIVVFAVPMTNFLFIKATSEDLRDIKVLISPL